MRSESTVFLGQPKETNAYVALGAAVVGMGRQVEWRIGSTDMIGVG
jgi:hypothetical protein